MNETLDAIKTGVDTLVNGFHYIFHPGEGCKILFLKISEASYCIALVIGISGIFLYICGSKKSRKWIPISLTGYALLQAIASVVRIK